VTAVRLHREVSGLANGPALVLVHSIGCSLAMWEPQVEVLARRFRLVRADIRGHGRSPAPPGPYTIAELGGDLVALLDDLDIERAHLCGLSLGGMVGMWVAAHHPDRVDRLVVCASSAKLGPPERWAARAATVENEGMAAIAEAVVSRWFTPAFADHCPDVVSRYLAMLEATPPVGYAGCCRAIETMDLSGDLAAIQAATLVLAGADDLATGLHHSELIAAGIRGARLAVVPDAAHLVNVEGVEAVNALLLEHLETIDQAQPRKEPS